MFSLCLHVLGSLSRYAICTAIMCIGDDEALNVVTRPVSDHGISEVHCGLYSLYAASNALDRPLKLRELFNGDFVSMAEGSTASDLVQAAQQNGLAAARVRGLTIVGLAELNCPVLLQLNLGHLSKTQHWVACVGVSRTSVDIIDAPQPVEEWSFAELEASWTGVAIPVWNPELSPPPIGWVQLGSFVSRVSKMSIPVLMSVLILAIRKPLSGIKVTNDFVVVGLQIMAIIFFVVAWSTFVFLMSPEQLRFGKTIEQISCWFDEGTGVSYVKSIDPNAFLIDSRVRADFEGGHIDTAISVPINTSFHEFSKFAKSVDCSRPIIVYCQSVHCQWAATTCRRLKCFDIDAKVLVGGYQLFAREHSN